jgi:hypothetical protein
MFRKKKAKFNKILEDTEKQINIWKMMKKTALK